MVGPLSVVLVLTAIQLVILAATLGWFLAALDLAGVRYIFSLTDDLNVTGVTAALVTGIRWFIAVVALVLNIALPLGALGLSLWVAVKTTPHLFIRLLRWMVPDPDQSGTTPS